MADKTIGDLNYAPGTVDDSNTLFVVQQSGAAYKLDGHTFILALTTILDGHGGVSSITYTSPVSPSLDGTMTITLADGSETEVTVTNGKGISSIAKTGTSGLVDTYTITYNDSTSSTFTVTNGAKGDTGAAWYVWIKYAGSQPTQDSDMGNVPDNWMGIYSGTASSAPAHYTSYSWFQIKGATGDTGAAATITSTDIEYQQSISGTTVPTGSWSSSIPTVTQGNFLWTRTTIAFNSGSPIVFYSVSYVAVDGEGSPGSATPLVDSGSGVVGTATAYSRQDHQHPINVATTGTPVMDGTASLGSAGTYARTDHVHPTDTSRQATLVSGTNIKTINNESILGSGNISITSGVSSVNGETGTVVLDADDVKALSEKLIWTNASPTSSFNSQTLQISMTDYDYIRIVMRYNTDTDKLWEFTVSKDNTLHNVNILGDIDTSGNTTFLVRGITVSSSGITFGHCNYKSTANNQQNTYDAACVPTKIYGIKGVQTS